MSPFFYSGGARPIPHAGAAIVNGKNVPYHGKWPFMVSYGEPFTRNR